LDEHRTFFNIFVNVISARVASSATLALKSGEEAFFAHCGPFRSLCDPP
jgi:hypothetical protein